MAIKLRKNPIKRFANQPENQLCDEFTIFFFIYINQMIICLWLSIFISMID